MEGIRAVELTKRFGPVTAVDRLSLEVARGEIFGLVGPDGAGKTTTMRLLTAVMTPSGGEAWVAGHHIVREAERLKEKIGYMSQRFGLYPDLTVAENIDFYADIYGVPHRELGARTDELLAFSGLQAFRRRRAGRLSGGMKQKLGLCCALIHTPEVLFLDEPTNGVDPVSRRDFWRMLNQLLRQQVTIFVSTAYLEEAERCHRVALLHEGRIVACDTPAGVKRLLMGQVLEISIPRPRQVAELIRQRLPEVQVGLYGDRIHLAAPDLEAALKAVSEVLAGAGLAAAATRRIQPTLEDVFVSVLSRREEVADGR